MNTVEDLCDFATIRPRVLVMMILPHIALLKLLWTKDVGWMRMGEFDVHGDKL